MAGSVWRREVRRLFSTFGTDVCRLCWNWTRLSSKNNNYNSKWDDKILINCPACTNWVKPHQRNVFEVISCTFCNKNFQILKYISWFLQRASQAFTKHFTCTCTQIMHGKETSLTLKHFFLDVCFCITQSNMVEFWYTLLLGVVSVKTNSLSNLLVINLNRTFTLFWKCLIHVA